MFAAVAAASLTAAACSGGGSDDSAASESDDDAQSAAASATSGGSDEEYVGEAASEVFDVDDEPVGEDFHESLDELRAETPEPAETPIDRIACDLVNSDDVIALGYEVAAGPTEGSSGDECTFTIRNRFGSKAPVVVAVYSPDDAEGLGPELHPETEPLAEIGVEAWAIDPLQLAQARLADGRVVSVQDVAAEASREALVQLLDRIAERA